MLSRPYIILTIGSLFIPILTIQAQTEFQVTNNGSSSYDIDGETNPAITLQRDSTYIFHISTPGHPFWIKTVRSTGTGSPYDDGVTGNGTSQGDLVFTVPSDAPDQLFYDCQFHSPMTGTFTIEGALGGVANNDALPLTYGLYGIFPNPFNPAATISYGLPEAAEVLLVVYDLRGREVLRLVDGRQEAGYLQIIWNGRDAHGRELPSGIYLTRLATDKYTKSIKMVLLK